MEATILRKLKELLKLLRENKAELLIQISPANDGGYYVDVSLSWKEAEEKEWTHE